MPSGRRRPPVAPAERAIGSTGSTHGESAVAAPAMKPKRTSSAIGTTLPGRDYEEMKKGSGRSAAGRSGGDPAFFARGDVGGAARFLADPEVGADSQLVLTAQRPGWVNDGGAADRLTLLGDPDAEGS